jgi:hypothetical protein
MGEEQIPAFRITLLLDYRNTTYSVVFFPGLFRSIESLTTTFELRHVEQARSWLIVFRLGTPMAVLHFWILQPANWNGNKITSYFATTPSC